MIIFFQIKDNAVINKYKVSDISTTTVMMAFLKSLKYSLLLIILVSQRDDIKMYETACHKSQQLHKQ